MLFSDRGTFLIGRLLVFFIMTVIRIKKITYFSDFVLEMDGFNFGIV